MSDFADPITRLNAALEGRYRIESELGEGLASHLHGALVRAPQEFGFEPPDVGASVLVLAGGWRSQGVEDLGRALGLRPG